jgi:predicted nucleotidyltransferase component of viral defense system
MKTGTSVPKLVFDEISRFAKELDLSLRVKGTADER